MRVIIAALLICTAHSLAAREIPRYPVSAIPENLKLDAYAVIRDDHMAFTIQAINNASLHVHQAVTIFNENGKHFAKTAVWYDKLRKITSMKAQVYDAQGVLIKKLKPNEITDHSAFEGLYSDNRMKFADLTQGHYPYTIEIEYDVEYKFLYFIDGSAINQHEDVAVQNASYQLSFPEHLKPRYKTYNIKQQPKEQKIKDVVSLTWTFENIAAQKFEVFSDIKNVVMQIEAAPTRFEFEGYAGSMQSWNDYGKWIGTLNKGRNSVPEETKKKIIEITSNLNTVEEKIRTVYHFLQNKTRYVSIQLGIGGYQPFEASVVDKTGYGDCKALSNYMISLLETVNIKGNYALILGGENQENLEVDFPSSQFNHAIVAVPNGPDTVWLECTSQTDPFGYQGRFTGDRKALLITDQGATVVNTTRYPTEVNLQTTSADVHLGLTGDAKATVKTVNSGLQYENGNLNFVVSKPYDDQKKWLQRRIKIPIFDINSFVIKNFKNRIPSAEITAELTMNRFATLSGKRIFLTPNMMNRSTFVPEKVEKRQMPIVVKMGYIEFDTIRYHLPENIFPEFLPADIKIQNRFGEYEARFKVEQGTLVYIRKAKINKGEFPPESYPELVDFYRNMSKSDNTKIVFINKT